jgi:hypothetical protein
MFSWRKGSEDVMNVETQFYSQLSERASAIGECLIGRAVR